MSESDSNAHILRQTLIPLTNEEQSIGVSGRRFLNLRVKNIFVDTLTALNLTGNTVTASTSLVTAYIASGSYLKTSTGGAVVGQATPLPTADLGSGSATNTTFLRGDQTWATPPGTGNVTTSVTLTANRIVLGNGAADLVVLSSLGTTTTLLHGNAAGAPSFSGVAIADHTATGTPSSTTFLRGDNTWNTALQGSGANTQIGFFTAATVMGSSALLTWDNTNTSLAVAKSSLNSVPMVTLSPTVTGNRHNNAIAAGQYTSGLFINSVDSTTDNTTANVGSIPLIVVQTEGAGFSGSSGAILAFLTVAGVALAGSNNERSALSAATAVTTTASVAPTATYFYLVQGTGATSVSVISKVIGENYSASGSMDGLLLGQDDYDGTGTLMTARDAIQITNHSLYPSRVSPPAPLASWTNAINLIDNSLGGVPSRFVVTNTGFHGINPQIANTVTPVTELEVASNQTTNQHGINSLQYGANANAAQIALFKSRATDPTQSASAVLANDILGAIGFKGDDGTNKWNASNVILGAAISGIVGSNWTNSSHEAHLVFSVTPVSSTTNAEAGRFTSAKNLNLVGKIGTYNNANPTAGQVMIGDGTNHVFTAATITAGANIAVTNGDGTITIAATGLAGGTVTTSGSPAAHQVAIFSAAAIIAGVAVGSTGQYLRGVSSADPIWSTLVLPNAATTGDIIVATSTNTLGSLAIVAAGQVLISGSAPAWSASPSVTTITATTHNAAAGTAVSFTAVAPAATTGVAAQAGTTANLIASVAVADTSTAGAAAGGQVNITSGAAARLTSGNANGGNILVTLGQGIGTGIGGILQVNNNTTAPTTSGILAGTLVQFTGLDATAAIIYMESFGAATRFVQRRAGGTNASPTALATNTNIASQSYSGYYTSGGPAWSTVQNWASATTAEAWTSAAQGLYVRLFTTPTGATTAVETFRVGANGNTDLGTNQLVLGSAIATSDVGLQRTASGVLSVTNATSGSGTLASGVTAPGTPLAGAVFLNSIAFASLGTPTNGHVAFCNDCDPPTLVDSTCASVGTKTGSLAVRVNGAWKCIS